VETFPQSDRGKARDQVADLTGANPRYVSDAKRLKQAAPQVFARVVNRTVFSQRPRNYPTRSVQSDCTIVIGNARCLDLGLFGASAWNASSRRPKRPTTRRCCAPASGGIPATTI